MFHDAVKALPREIVQRTYFEGKVSIVHEHVDRTKLLLCGLHHVLGLIFPRHVRLEDHTSRSGAFDLCEYFPRGLFVLVIIHNNSGAAFGKPLGGGCANTAAGTGHQRNFSFKRAGLA